MHLYVYIYTYIDIYMLDARERAIARSLLDPSDPSDAKAFSPIWTSDFLLLTTALSPPISELGFAISITGPQPLAQMYFVFAV